MGDEKENAYAGEDLFANEETRGDPVTGKRYMWFSILMVIFLSLMVLSDAKHINLKAIAKTKLEQAKANSITVDDKKKESTKTESKTTKAEPTKAKAASSSSSSKSTDTKSSSATK